MVEPPAISGERERFLLELEPHARAQVTLYTKANERLAAAALRPEHRARRARAQAAQLRQSGRVRLLRTTWRATIFTGPPPAPPARSASCPAAAARRFKRPPWTCAPPIWRASSALYHGDDYRSRHDAGHADRPDIPAAEGLDRRLPQHRHLSRAGDLRNARGHPGGLLPLLAAPVLRSRERGAAAHGGGGVALRAADAAGGAPCVARGRRPDAGVGGRLFLPRAPRPQSAGGRGARLPGARPGSALRRQLPAHLSGGGLSGRVRHAADPGHFRPAGARPGRSRRYATATSTCAPRVAQFRIEMRLLAETVQPRARTARRALARWRSPAGARAALLL